MRRTGILLLLLLGFFQVHAQTLTSSNLPIVVINTGGQTIPDEPKVTVTMSIIWNGPGSVNTPSDPPTTGWNGDVGIEIRGNSTQDADKKSYGFELRDPLGNDTSEMILGMPKEEDWILQANHFDKTFLRNAISFHIWEKMGYWAPRYRYVEVVVDGEYRGLYLLCEKIKRDNDRMDLAKLKDTDISGEEVSGGYILELNWPEDDDDGWYSNYQSQDGDELFLQYHYPRADRIQPEQAAYIQAYVDSFETAIFSSTYTHPTTGIRWDEYADKSTFADQMIINEFSRSVDGYKLSTYMHKQKRNNGGKLRMGSIWDFDNAYDNADYCGAQTESGWTWPQTADGCDDLYLMSLWWERMWNDPVFTARMRCRWDAFRADFLNETYLHDWIDTYVDSIQQGVDRNFIRWDVLDDNLFAQPEPIPGTYAGEVAILKQWVTDRINWMDANLPGNCADDVTGIPSEISGPEISISPNPASTRMRVQWNGRATQRLEIINSMGQTVESLDAGGLLAGWINIDVSRWTPGMYFLRALSVEVPGVSTVSKFVVD